MNTLKYTLWAFLFVMGFSLSSCMHGDEDELIYYNDAAVSSFSIGKVKQLVETTGDDGTTTQSYKEVDLSSTKFTIDHVNRQIYNTDSLPVGIDPSRILCTVSSKNGGSIQLQPKEGGEYEYFNPSDTVDFSPVTGSVKNERRFRVQAMSGSTYRDYTVEIRIHKEVGDTFIWKDKLTTSAVLASLTNMRALCVNGKIVVLGARAGAGSIFISAETDGSTWTEADPHLGTLSEEVAFNVAVMEDNVYLLNDGKLYVSADASQWTEVGSVDLKQLIGASKSRLYGLTQAGGIASSADGGQSWTPEELDTDGSYLPTQDFNLLCTPSKINKDTYQLLIIGNRNLANETVAQQWGKVEQNDADAQQQSWSYYGVSSEIRNKAPHLQNLQVKQYGDRMIAIGGKGMNGVTTEALSHFYESRDGGVTWPVDTTMAFPKGFSSNDDHFAMTVDSQNYIWIVCGGTGQVWKGRLNRLGWREEEGYVTQ